MADIYDTQFVEALFDEMAGTYETVNYISSFGFSKRWRRQFVRKVRIRPGMVICDMMCGMGECWDAAAAGLADGDRLIGIDISEQMLRGAERRKAGLRPVEVTIIKEDALKSLLDAASVDCLICGFGLKTLSAEQQEVLFGQMARVLKPGGVFSLVEVSVPKIRLLKGPYMFYLKTLIPLIGRIVLGNPDNYRMLGVYTERFGNCQGLVEALARHGLRADYNEYFLGCATGVSGVKVSPASGQGERAAF